MPNLRRSAYSFLANGLSEDAWHINAVGLAILCYPFCFHRTTFLSGGSLVPYLRRLPHNSDQQVRRRMACWLGLRVMRCALAQNQKSVKSGSQRTGCGRIGSTSVHCVRLMCPVRRALPRSNIRMATLERRRERLLPICSRRTRLVKRPLGDGKLSIRAHVSCNGERS
jgi:hypothetical protein